MMEAIDLHHSLIMSLEQLMALAGHLAQTPRPPAAMRPASGMTRQTPLLSADEVAALRDIWSTPLRSQMADLSPFRDSGFKH
jgi:hypothetical protein